MDAAKAKLQEGTGEPGEAVLRGAGADEIPLVLKRPMRLNDFSARTRQGRGRAHNQTRKSCTNSERASVELHVAFPLLQRVVPLSGMGKALPVCLAPKTRRACVTHVSGGIFYSQTRPPRSLSAFVTPNTRCWGKIKNSRLSSVVAVALVTSLNWSQLPRVVKVSINAIG